MTGFGAAIRARRLELGLSQNALAGLMVEHGWHQTTVARVEMDSRELRWGEGISLSGLIGAPVIPIDDLTVIRDAMAYRRILRAIAEREAEEVGS